MQTLKKRGEFLRLRQARGRSTKSARIAGALRDDPSGAPRIGYTVTKKLGSAVIRNRIRRRLRAAVAIVGDECGKPGWDYVIIARRAALHRPFDAMLDDLRRGLLSLTD
ncbi:MAG: ribonuclease P protein component [Pseudomonadota bacterium]